MAAVLIAVESVWLRVDRVIFEKERFWWFVYKFEPIVVETPGCILLDGALMRDRLAPTIVKLKSVRLFACCSSS